MNDQLVDEPYVKTGMGTPVRRQTIPPGQVFVLGDNRTNSSDSRVYGPIAVSRSSAAPFLKLWGSGTLERI